VQPGQQPGRKWYEKFGGDSAYISIPVTNDRNLRHEFHAAVDHVSPGHAFDAFFILDFCVSSQETVALQWAEDPVRKVEMEIRRVLNGLTSAADWNSLYREIKLDGAVSYFDREVRERSDLLDRFAKGYGIHIEQIRMKLRLSKKDAQPDEKEADLERSRRITESDKQEKVVKTIADHEVKVLETRNTADLQMIEQWGKLRAGAAGHVDTALGNIAQNTKSGAELRRNVEMIQGLAIGAGAGGGMGQAPPGFPPVGNQLPGSSNPLLAAGAENKLVTTVTLVATSVDSLNGDLSRKRELASKLLHLVAEAWLGKDGPSDVMEKYAEDAKQLLSQFNLTSEQFVDIGRLTNVRTLQGFLK
jgi:hypothetical protein